MDDNWWINFAFGYTIIGRIYITIGIRWCGLEGQMVFKYKTWQVHRFSAFWLRSKCSICSYQLNIWYEDHVSSSILNLFLQGDGTSGACSGSITSWLCIAVPQSSAHFPTFKSWLIRSKCRARLRSERWFLQGEAAPLHLGVVDPCDFPKCGKLDVVIFVSGDLRSR